MITGLLLDVGMEISVCRLERSVLESATHLNQVDVLRMRLSVITGLLLDVGMEIFVSPRETSARRLAILLLRPNAGKAKLSVIMDQLLDVGMAITASLKETSARHLAIPPPQLVVLKASRPATWGPTLGAGWATIVYPRSLTVLQSVTTLLLCLALKEK